MNYSLSSITGKNEDTPPPLGTQPEPAKLGLGLVNLNEVVQNNLIARRQKIEDLKAIIRYDALPHVQGNASEISKLFGLILNSILENPPLGTKLFIYLKCEMAKDEVPEIMLPDNFHYYAISIYTNISADAGWQQLQQPQLEEVKEIVQHAHGVFTHQAILNTGCLYNIALPGKLI